MYTAACNGGSCRGISWEHGSCCQSSTDKYMNSCGLFTYNKKLKNGGKKVKSTFGPSGPEARAYTGFCSMKRLGVFLLPPGWDSSPSQGYTQH